MCACGGGSGYERLAAVFLSFDLREQSLRCALDVAIEASLRRCKDGGHHDGWQRRRLWRLWLLLLVV